MENYNVNRRLLLLSGLVAVSIVMESSSEALATKMPLSVITVEVLSVDRESVDQPLRSVERTHYLAKVRIIKVGHNEHGNLLLPGAVIDVQYTVQKPPSPYRTPEGSLRAGETATLNVSGGFGGARFTWRN